MRLGELLVREGVIDVRKLELGLQRAEQQKVRIGTALVELGFVDVDTIARALSAIHQVPAVLSKHATNIERSVIALIPPIVAKKLRAIPLGWTPTKPPRLVVGFENPRTTPLDELTVAAGARIEVGVAPELLVNRCLTKYYGVTTSAANMRFVNVDPAALRASDSSEPPPPRHAVVKTLSLPPLPMPPSFEEQKLEPPPIPVVESLAEALPEPPVPEEEPLSLVPVLTTDDAIVALKATTSSDEIGNVLATWLHSTYGLGLVLVVKDILGLAIGWRGWAADLDQASIDSIAVPLGPPSMFMSVYEGKVAFRGPPPDEGVAVHRKLWTALGGEAPSQALVVPVMLGERMVNILYAHVTGDAVIEDSALEDAARIAREATTAYARIVRKPKS